MRKLSKREGFDALQMKLIEDSRSQVRRYARVRAAVLIIFVFNNRIENDTFSIVPYKVLILLVANVLTHKSSPVHDSLHLFHVIPTVFSFKKTQRPEP